MERKEVDTQQFIDHTLLASELGLRDPNNFIMDLNLMDHSGVFPKSEGPTNLTTNGNNANSSNDYSEKDELNFHNYLVDRIRTPDRNRSYSAGKEADVEFLTLNSTFLSAATAATASEDNNVSVPQATESQPAFPALAIEIEPTVPIDAATGLQDDELLYAHSVSTTNARKVLPHKKRISRKLKGTMSSIETGASNASAGYDLEPHKHAQVAQGNAVLYSCEICGYAVQTQLDFFAHLKQHYEPNTLEQRFDVPQQQKEPLDMCGLTAQDKLQQEQAKLDQVFHDVQLNFENFHNIAHVDDDDVGVGVGVGVSVVDDVGVNMVIHADAIALHKLPRPHVDEKMAPVATPYVPTVAERALKSAVNDVPVVDDVEFSDTEDMLEGIRNVVDKVSIEDTCDELDLELTSSGMRAAPWFNNNFSDIAFSGPLSQLLLPGEPPPPAPRHETSPLIKSNASDAEQLTLNFLNTAKRTESEAKLEAHLNMKKDFNGPSNEQTLLVDPPRSPTPTAAESIEQLQRSPLMLSESFKLEDVESAPPPSSLSLSAASDSMAPPSPANSFYDSDDTNEVERQNTDVEEFVASNPSKAAKKLFRCEKCARDFNSYNALKYHNHTHTQERAHQCELCGRSFYTLSALKAHERTHSGEKPFNCEQCEAKFRQWGDLKYHIISRHSEIKAHMCEYCGKSFSRRYSLVVHRRIHTSERNYSCEHCHKSFRASSYLLTHIKVHTGEKPYACPICEKKFRVSGDLKRHIRVHERLPQSQDETARKKKRSKIKVKVDDDNNSTTKSELICESEQEILGL
ncbi:uncharacterized protein LOC115631446 [Scaptodrosophila lebanonensis]|uniref:Uncharacterized protein LOC115631446 n=1 Tax=Drosophila lebanonensis TaxID=7225 RepID=A0A6J2U7U4_DROLE|nr:uncharacterized protein LOC115631446 [Scaptodrosophila lebanonensis]